jgi:hypothetical protein
MLVAIEQERIDELFVSAGQSAGLVDEIETASDIVRRLVAEADDVSGAKLVVGGLGSDERGSSSVGDVERFTNERTDLVVGGAEAAACFGEPDELAAEEERRATPAAGAHGRVGMRSRPVVGARGERCLAESEVDRREGHDAVGGDATVEPTEQLGELSRCLCVAGSLSHFTEDRRLDAPQEVPADGVEVRGCELGQEPLRLVGVACLQLPEHRYATQVVV